MTLQLTKRNVILFSDEPEQDITSMFEEMLNDAVLVDTAFTGTSNGQQHSGIYDGNAPTSTRPHNDTSLQQDGVVLVGYANFESHLTS